ncbi:MAG: signal peptidase I [Candidatus Woesearchaeota archaeon]
MDWKDIKKETKDGLKKFWKFIWYEDSVLSWIVNILLAFIIIKFIIYPGIGLILGTNLPVVAVISESMSHRTTPTCQARNIDGICIQYHDDQYEICGKILDERMSLNVEEYWENCGDYYDNISISMQDFNKYPMRNGFNKGDIIILKGATFENLELGEILVYQSKLSYPVIHRVIAKNDVIETKGDHNPGQIYDSRINEKYITKDQIIGKAWLRVPYLGYVKIWFTQLVQCLSFNGCSFK